MTSTVTCLETSNWMLNTLSQNPCQVYAYVLVLSVGNSSSDLCVHSDLSTICTTNQHWTVTALANTNVTYAPPTAALINPCQCNAVAYTLVQACASCQNATVGRWDAWRKNCPDAFATTYWPYDVPSQTTIPPWAMLGLPSGGGVWNATAARAYAGAFSLCMRDKVTNSHPHLRFTFFNSPAAGSIES